ncbi:MAG TPA: bifunctional DNA-formamidopyrimidine glycosylase/DNA-(apurinic or apyrimidinic site) lyase [Armatimonadota bacterium]|jgi:formamidopyrimidine-DNA glycosylase
MPELPEIETVRRDLEGSITHAKITKVMANDPLIMAPAESRRLRQALKDQTIVSLERCGKVLIINVSGGHSVLQRFGMTGQMYPEPSRGALPPHTRMVWELADGRRLVYRDARRFGETRLVATESLAGVLREECRLGHDALEAQLSDREFLALLADHRIPIKNFLLDQRHLTGIGNIYAAEILHRARVNPETPANALTPAQARAILKQTRLVLAEAVAAQGTTISDYRTGENETGGFQKFLRVYGRAGEGCLRRGCKGKIARIVQSGRSTFYCPTCQPPT